jgi:hypothetical protein
VNGSAEGAAVKRSSGQAVKRSSGQAVKRSSGQWQCLKARGLQRGSLLVVVRVFKLLRFPLFVG